jgi:hypothetical protein
MEVSDFAGQNTSLSEFSLPLLLILSKVAAANTQLLPFIGAANFYSVGLKLVGLEDEAPTSG